MQSKLIAFPHMPLSSPVVLDGHQVDNASDVTMAISIPPSADLPLVPDGDSVSHQANSLLCVDHIDQFADYSDV